MQITQIINDNILFIFNCLIITETAFAIMVVFFLFSFKKNKNANFFLAFFVIVHSASFLSFCFYVNNLLRLSHLLSSITLPGNSLIGVFLYYYTLFMTGRAEKFNKNDIFHFLFFIVFMVYILVITLLFYFKITSYETNINDERYNIPATLLMMMGCGIINSIIYTLLSFIKIKKYSKDIKNYTSDIDSIDMTWLNKIIYFSILSTFIFVICYSTSISKISSLTIYFASIDIVVFITILFLLAFYSINQPELSKENPEMYSILNNLNKKHTIVKRIQKIHQDMHTQELYLKLLDEYMEKYKPYLNEKITIQDISEGLGWPYHHLSILINNLLKKNFWDFINEYRIREVLNILNESKNEAVNILTIAFKCGFNSKSTFNRVFKKRMGTTPSMYKNTNE